MRGVLAVQTGAFDQTTNDLKRNKFVVRLIGGTVPLPCPMRVQRKTIGAQYADTQHTPGLTVVSRNPRRKQPEPGAQGANSGAS